MPFAQTPDNIVVYYEIHGDGDPLILLGGQANTHRWWDEIRPDFEEVFTTITLDYRGTGRSDKPNTGIYSTRGFASDAMCVLDHLGLGWAHVYGTSMGGRVAQWIAADYPDRVDKLVLGCTSPGAPHGRERNADVKRSLAQPDTDAARTALLELMYSPAWRIKHVGAFNTLGDLTMPAYARHQHLRASAQHNSWDALPRISACTLVVHGTDDILNPAANALLLAERIPNARLHLIPGARHAYFEEFRVTASPLVLNFLREEN